MYVFIAYFTVILISLHSLPYSSFSFLFPRSFQFLDYSPPSSLPDPTSLVPILSPHPFPFTSPAFFRLLSICSAVSSWVAFNELFDERLSLAEQRVRGKEGCRSDEVVCKNLGGIKGVELENQHPLILLPSHLSLLYFLFPFGLFPLIPSFCFFYASLLPSSSSHLFFIFFLHYLLPWALLLFPYSDLESVCVLS